MADQSIVNNVVSSTKENKEDLVVRLSVKDIHYYCLQAVNGGKEYLDLTVSHIDDTNTWGASDCFVFPASYKEEKK